jgi:hypothetical protein
VHYGNDDTAGEGEVDVDNYEVHEAQIMVDQVRVVVWAQQGRQQGWGGVGWCDHDVGEIGVAWAPR